ncbi:MAG: T9SS type A sorting domain-containing protein, partial [Bacteroidota bacterium]
SYRALGQDGQRLNGTITSPTNTQVPSAVSQALFDVSDHLPVMLDVRVLNLPVSAEEVQVPGVELTLRNPVQEHLELQLTAPGWQQADMAIYTLSGQLVNTQRLQPSPEGFQTSGIRLEPGAYLLLITNEHGIQINRKVIKT